MHTIRFIMFFVTVQICIVTKGLINYIITALLG